jgi:hypothetical protein
MAPKRRLEDDHDDTDHDTGHSSTDGPPAKKTTSKLLRSLPDQADTLGAAPTAASMSNAASDSDVTEEPATTNADNGLDVTPTQEPRKRIMNVWPPEEIKFLTLIYEKLGLLRSKDDSFMVTNKDVYEAYERHFGTGRDPKSICMRLWRRDGSLLNNLYKQHGTGKQQKMAGRKLYKPNITQEELDAYIKDGDVQVESDAANPSQPASVTATEGRTTFEEYTFEEQQAALALVALSRSEDRPTASDEPRAALALDGSRTSMEEYHKALGLKFH